MLNHKGWTPILVGGSEKASEKRPHLGRELREQGLPYSSRLGTAGPAGTKCPVRTHPSFVKTQQCCHLLRRGCLFLWTSDLRI